jgi:hypothetical protein
MIIFVGFTYYRNNILCTSLGRYKGIENQQTSSKQKKYTLSIKFSSSAVITEVCKVFDESPTPKLEGVFPIFAT